MEKYNPLDHQGLVWYTIKRMLSGTPDKDCFQSGIIALINACKNYEKDKPGCEFSTYACTKIRKAVQNERKKNAPITISTQYRRNAIKIATGHGIDNKTVIDMPVKTAEYFDHYAVEIKDIYNKCLEIAKIQPSPKRIRECIIGLFNDEPKHKIRKRLKTTERNARNYFDAARRIIKYVWEL